MRAGSMTASTKPFSFNMLMLLSERGWPEFRSATATLAWRGCNNRDRRSTWNITPGLNTKKQMQIPRTTPRVPENRGNSNYARDSARDDNAVDGCAAPNGGTSPSTNLPPNGSASPSTIAGHGMVRLRSPQVPCPYEEKPYF